MGERGRCAADVLAGRSLLATVGGARSSPAARRDRRCGCAAWLDDRHDDG
eukprot:SAG31_NODE_686_length_12815_cov_5.367175_10_plen_50_part_00